MRIPVPALLLLALALQVLPLTARAESLEEYARKCDAAIGVTVPDFVCDAGTAVPTTHINGAKCDRPNQLNQVCDPGSKFQVLSESADAAVVAHCRKQSLGAGKFGDIAVIQYSKRNGATCFYQALASSSGPLDGNVKAPSKGSGAWPWLSPARTAAIDCVGCHDNGAIIRSPYLAQLKDVPGAKDVLPGSHDSSFNSSQPYSFVGEDFADWKAYSVEVRGNLCNSCHRMGVSNQTTLGASGTGTALDFGIRATAASQLNKNPHSADSPIWMLPGQTFFDENTLAAAQQIRSCALRRDEVPLPNSDSCRIRLLASAYVPPRDTGEEFAAIWEKPAVTFASRSGMTAAQYQAEFDKRTAEGYRLTAIDGYEIGGSARFAAIFEKRATPPWFSLSGLTGAQYQAEFEKAGREGFRVVWVNGYTVGGVQQFAAIWEKAPTNDYFTFFGLTNATFQQTLDQQIAQGFRLKLVSGYVVAGEPRFAVIFERSNGVAWLTRFGLTSAQLQTEFEANSAKGFRLAHVSGYRVNGRALYAAIWDKEPRQGYIARWGMSFATYQSEFDRYLAEGYSLKINGAY
jgi:hypothetical protein